jgi:hypothetical protein
VNRWRLRENTSNREESRSAVKESMVLRGPQAQGVSKISLVRNGTLRDLSCESVRSFLI